MSRSDVVVIDFRLNNLKSIVRGLELAGADRVRIAVAPDEVGDATHLVLPGVGHFSAAMTTLAAEGWPRALQVDLSDRPLLGVCLGMQLLFDGSDEGGSTAGLGLLRGRVTRLPRAPGHRVPHVGWNSVVPTSVSSGLFAGLGGDLDYYFVHGYSVGTCEPEVVLARTPFGGGDCISAVGHNSTVGVQFHPEKSSRPGIRLLANFLEFSRC